MRSSEARVPFTVSIDCDAAASDCLVAELAAFPITGIVEEDLPGPPPARLRLIAHFDARADAEACRDALAPEARLEALPDPVDWSPAWQSQWTPFPLGKRFYLAPAGFDVATPPEGRIRLDMHPGLIFGGGDHPTTQLCLLLLEEFLTLGDTVLDIGTGTGILAQAARLLGADRVLACDIDLEAAKQARRWHPMLPVWAGDTTACRGEAANVVVANLPGGLLIDLIPELTRLLAPPPSRLLLSGCLLEQVPALTAVLLKSKAFTNLQWRTQEDWAAVAACRTP
jgi:ribosomal protein L11 methyltransferase